MSKGIDVSNNNGHVDWAQIAGAGYRFAYAKATEGTGFIDPFYEQNRAGAKAHSIPFGAYHYFTPGEDAAAQVMFFLDHAQPRTGDLVPTLDYERSPAEAAPAEQFVTRMHRELGYYPVFYSYLSFIGSMRISAASPLARCLLWLADYTTARPATPRPWHEIGIWQNSSSGSIPGIGGPVDLDVGAPVVIPTPRPREWHVASHTRDGSKHAPETTKHPARFLMRHPRRKFNGRIIFDPIHRP